METTDSSAQPAKGRILIADQDGETLDQLGLELTMHGYTAVPAASGAAALRMIEEEPPDLALLALDLPDFNGFELCTRIKSSPTTRSVPVVLMTASRETSVLVKGLDTGADEFIGKPVDKAELLARVRSLLRAAHLRRALEKALRECSSLQRTKDQLNRLVIHDLRGPVTSVLGALDILKEDLAELKAERPLWLLEKARRACESIQEMVDTLVDIEKMERGEMRFLRTPLPAAELVRAVEDHWTPLAQTKKLKLSFNYPKDLVLVGDPVYLRRAIGNMLTNAIRLSPAGSPLVLQLADEGERIRITLTDEGPGMPPESLEKVFDPVWQAKRRAEAREGSYGLGLTVVRMVAEGHGGRAWAEANKPRGSRISFSISKESKA